MPVTIKVRVEAARDLPVMDRKTELTDAYVELRFGTTVERTESFHKSLNPAWHKAFRVEVSEDASLQNTPIEFRVYDYDVVSSDDSIGVVFVDVSSLLYRQPERRHRRHRRGRTPALTEAPEGAGSENSSENSSGSSSNSDESENESESGSDNEGSTTSNSSDESDKKIGEEEKEEEEKEDEDEEGKEQTAEGATTKKENEKEKEKSEQEEEDEKAPTIRGWFPIYDTLKGVRGELCLSVQLEGIANWNPNAETSGRVQFFASERLLPALVLRVAGLVSACVVDEDPEHQWADTFRTSRTSNEARQLLLYTLTGRVRRQLACKAQDLGCNAVLGYRQSIELEGETGLVVRGYGTAALVARKPVAPATDRALVQLPAPAQLQQLLADHSPCVVPPSAPVTSNAPTAGPDDEATPGDSLAASAPAGGAPLLPSPMLTGAASPGEPSPLLSASCAPPVGSGAIAVPIVGGGGGGTHSAASSYEGSLHSPRTHLGGASAHAHAHARAHANAQRQGTGAGAKPAGALQARHVPLLTLGRLDVGAVRHVGGVVASRVVRVLRGAADAKERARWWAEARDEVRQSALAMGCTHVIGYTESVATHEAEAVCVLSAVGTAVCLATDARSRCYSVPGSGLGSGNGSGNGSGSGPTAPNAQSQQLPLRTLTALAAARIAKTPAQVRAEERRGACRACHVPYARRARLPFPTRLAACGGCGRHAVPDFVLATAELPDELAVVGAGRLLQARVCRAKRRGAGAAASAAVATEALTAACAGLCISPSSPSCRAPARNAPAADR